MEFNGLQEKRKTRKTRISFLCYRDRIAAPDLAKSEDLLNSRNGIHNSISHPDNLTIHSNTLGTGRYVKNVSIETYSSRLK